MQHVHDCFEIGLCLKGSGIFVVEDEILPFAAGDLITINARVMHGLRIAPGEESDWNFIFVDLVRLLDDVEEDRAVLGAGALTEPGFPNVVSPDQTYAHWLLRRLIGELSQPHGAAHRSLVRAYLWALVIELHRLVRHEPATRSPVHLGRLHPALRYLTEHYSEPVRTIVLARACHVSEATLRRLFQAGLGCTPQERLARRRIQMACSLLRTTDRKVIDVAMDVGYGAPSSFNRQFRRQLGCSAAVWRRQRGAENDDQGLQDGKQSLASHASGIHS